MKPLVATLVFAAVAHLAHARLLADKAAEAPLVDVLPSVEALRLTSLGYKSVFADYYWLRSINEFGDKKRHRMSYPNLMPLVQRTLALDPYYVKAYEFAGIALTGPGFDVKQTVALLEQGAQYRPDSWRIPYLLGFDAYFFLNDYARGAEALATAAHYEGAPAQLGPLATRLAAKAGVPEIGIAMIDDILDGVTDPQLRATYEERRRLLQLELELRWLNDAAQKYATDRGQAAASLEELVRAGLLKRVPNDPVGGSYFIDAGGLVHSTSDDKRLDLPKEPAAGAKP